MKLLLDEMWPARIAEQLRLRSYDVVAIAERQDLRGRTDEEIFAMAQDEERAIVTENVLDFRPMAIRHIQRGGAHHGLILTSNRRFPRHDPRTAGRLVTSLSELLSQDPESPNLEYWLSPPE